MHTVSRLPPFPDAEAAHECAYRSLLTQMADPVLVLDASRHVLFANRTADRLLLAPAGEARSRVIVRSHQDDDARVRAACEQVLAGDDGVRVDQCRFRSREGTWRLFDVALYAWREPGCATAIVLVARDVTDDRVRERQRQESEMLEAAADASALVARDVDALLRELGRHLDMMTAAPAEGARAEALRMRRTLDRAWVLVQQLHSFDRAGTADESAGLDINEAVAHAAPHLQQLAGPDVDVIHLLGAEQARVAMSPSDLEEVLAALIVRTRHAIRGPGRIVIETRDSVEHPWPQAEDAAPAQWLVIQVTDSGVAIDAAARVRLESGPAFPDSVADADRVPLLVRRAGGEVSVESDSVLGTTVRVHLPVVSARQTR
jgi:PAS domain S-box-containing protein